MLKEIDEVYSYLRSLSVNNDVLYRKRFITKKMTLWSELNLPVTPFSYLLKDHFVSQIIALDG